MMDGHTRQHVYLRSLLEEQGRRHAAVEALKIGFGGFAYVVRVLGMSRRTIYTGIGELEAMGNEDHPPPPRFAPDRPGSGTAHPHQNRPHGHATPARYPLRAGIKCSETFLDTNDKFIHHDPVLGK